MISCKSSLPNFQKKPRIAFASLLLIYSALLGAGLIYAVSASYLHVEIRNDLTTLITERSARIVSLLTGLPGDVESENVYREQLQSWLEWLTASPARPSASRRCGVRAGRPFSTAAPRSRLLRRPQPTFPTVPDYRLAAPVATFRGPMSSCWQTGDVVRTSSPAGPAARSGHWTLAESDGTKRQRTFQRMFRNLGRKSR